MHNIKFSQKLSSLPPYPFLDLDRKMRVAVENGKDVISFGIGDPDLPTPKHIVEYAQKMLLNQAYHSYPSSRGLMDFRQSVSQWYMDRFNVHLDPKSEIVSTIGSKDGLSHVQLAFVNPGDIVLIPNPGYPVYWTSTIFSESKPVFLPLCKEKSFFPDLDAISSDVLKKAKVLFLNSPNNPTASVITEDYFKKVVSIAKKYNILVCHDAAYSEIYFKNKPCSFFNVDGAKDVGLEFHSCSKSYNMTGWRIGWVCGHKRLIDALVDIKSNFDSGVFEVVQMAAAYALSSSQDCVEEMRRIYRDRRDILVSSLNKIGFDVDTPDATFYVWVKHSSKYSSADLAMKFIDEASVVVTPGTAFGSMGEGYIRFALTVPSDRIVQACDRIAKLSL